MRLANARLILWPGKVHKCVGKRVVVVCSRSGAREVWPRRKRKVSSNVIIIDPLDPLSRLII